MQSFNFFLLIVSEKKIFEYYQKFSLYDAVATNQIKQYGDKSHMKSGGSFNKHFCKQKKLKYPKWDSRNCQFPLFTLYSQFKKKHKVLHNMFLGKKLLNAKMNLFQWLSWNSKIVSLYFSRLNSPNFNLNVAIIT